MKSKQPNMWSKFHPIIIPDSVWSLFCQFTNAFLLLLFAPHNIEKTNLHLLNIIIKASFLIPNIYDTDPSISDFWYQIIKYNNNKVLLWYSDTHTVVISGMFMVITTSVKEWQREWAIKYCYEMCKFSIEKTIILLTHKSQQVIK